MRKRDYGQFTALPMPDTFGNYYWRNGKGKPTGTAIFVRLAPKRHHPDRYFLAVNGMPLFDGDELREFDAATDALRWIQRLIDQGVKIA